MLADEDCADFQGAPAWDRRNGRRFFARACLPGLPPPDTVLGDAIEVPNRSSIEITEGVRLDLMGDDPKQQVLWQVQRRTRSEELSPADPKFRKVQSLPRFRR